MGQKNGEKLPRVVIVGAGFGGLAAARVLGASARVQLTVLDRRNYHLFQPLLYQVATAGLSPAEIAAPVRSLLSKYPNTEVMLSEVTSVNVSKRTLLQSDGKELAYDYLILACGAQHSYFNHPEWEQHAPGLKTLEQATEIRRRILLAFELAEKETDPEKRKQLQTFVVVGAGPTGVELAGAIAEISRTTLERDFRSIDPSRTRVVLIEANPRILMGFDAALAKRAARDLERLGVQIWTESRVSMVTADGVQLGEEALKAKTVIWAAGVAPSSLGKTLGAPLDPLGRVIVTPELSLPGRPEVFVIGDQTLARDLKTQAPLPGLAPVAMQQGRYVGRIILREISESKRNTAQPKAREPFRYLDKGQMATIGRRSAIVQFGRMRFGGALAWMAWLFIHIFYLIGFKNRVFVLYQWAWSYVTFGRGARLIVDKEWRINP